MARPRAQLTADQEARIVDGMRRGETATRIAATIGGSVSASTVGRRMKEIRGPLAAPRVTTKQLASATTSAQKAVEDVPEDVPENTPLDQLAAWIDQVTEAIDKVAPGAVDENLPLFGQLIARAATLSETRRKATPPAKPDPNDNPDMRRLAADVLKRLHTMIDLVAVEAAGDRVG